MRVWKKLLASTTAATTLLVAGHLFADITGITATPTPIVVGKLENFQPKDDGSPPLNQATSLNWYLICNKGSCAPLETQLGTPPQGKCQDFVGEFQMKLSVN